MSHAMLPMEPRCEPVTGSDRTRCEGCAASGPAVFIVASELNDAHSIRLCADCIALIYSRAQVVCREHGWLPPGLGSAVPIKEEV